MIIEKDLPQTWGLHGKGDSSGDNGDPLLSLLLSRIDETQLVQLLYMSSSESIAALIILSKHWTSIKIELQSLLLSNKHKTFLSKTRISKLLDFDATFQLLFWSRVELWFSSAVRPLLSCPNSRDLRANQKHQKQNEKRVFECVSSATTPSCRLPTLAGRSVKSHGNSIPRIKQKSKTTFDMSQKT